MLVVTFSAFTTPGFASLAGAAQWARDRSRPQLLALGAWTDSIDQKVYPPGEATLRRIPTRIDPQALTTACVACTLARLS